MSEIWKWFPFIALLLPNLADLFFLSVFSFGSWREDRFNLFHLFHTATLGSESRPWLELSFSSCLRCPSRVVEFSPHPPLQRLIACAPHAHPFYCTQCNDSDGTWYFMQVFLWSSIEWLWETVTRPINGIWLMGTRTSWREGTRGITRHKKGYCKCEEKGWIHKGRRAVEPCGLYKSKKTWTWTKTSRYGTKATAVDNSRQECACAWVSSAHAIFIWFSETEIGGHRARSFLDFLSFSFHIVAYKEDF